MDTQNEGIPESVAADLDALDRDGVVQGNIGDMQFFSEFIEDELLGMYNFFHWPLSQNYGIWLIIIYCLR